MSSGLLCISLWLLYLLGPPQTRPPSLDIAARAMRPGEVVLVTVRTSTPATAVSGRVFTRAVPATQVSPATWQLILGIDLETKPGPYLLEVALEMPTGPAHLSQPFVVAPRAFPTRRLTVAEGFVNPPPEVLTRIAEEARDLDRIWTRSTAVRGWSGPFVRPVPQAANSAFGTRSIFNGQPRSPHGGADFPSPSGTPVHAPGGGVVVLARELYYTGQTVVVDHGLGIVSLFAHLSRMHVREGDGVIGGQPLGLVGATGRVTGPHLHWSLRVGTARVDPLSLLAELGPEHSRPPE